MNNPNQKLRKRKSPSLKNSCPNCGKKVFDVKGHQKRSKCIRKRTPNSPGSDTPLRRPKRRTSRKICH